MLPVKQKLSLLVAIPCLNEAATIADVVANVPREISGIARVDVLVVDDGSSDETAAEARQAGAIVIQHPGNRGVGVAFQTAAGYAVDRQYDVMVNIDGDRQFNPQDIPKLVEPVLRGAADMVTASRFVDKSLIPDMPKVKLFGNHMMSYLISRLIRQRFHDVSCGFRCYNREALLRLNLHGAFTYTQESFLDFAVKNLRIKEVPIEVQYFPDRKSRVAGSIWKYAVNTATIIFRGYRDYFPLRFFSRVSMVFILPSMPLGLLFFGSYFVTGRFSGFLFAGFSAAFLFTLGVLFLVLGVVTDMLDRIRSNQERILYHLKKHQAPAVPLDMEP